MERTIFYNYITLIFICQIAICFLPAPLAKAIDTENFYFDSFDADYYLSKNSEGISELKVVEKFTTVFPDFNQNKGICRMIPNTNQDGINRTLDRLNRSDIKVLRNGKTEPIYSIQESKDGYFEVCTGDDNYVLGTQEYTFEYTFKKVITEFAEDNKEWQELYWDTNGNGWTQRFNSVTARVHFDDPDMMTGEAWCYVGEYDAGGQERCGITSTSDGFSFTTSALRSYENLTFDIEIKADSFEVPVLEKDYTPYVVAGIATVIFAIFMIYEIYQSKEVNEKKEYHRSYFVKPEYIPHPKYHIQELSEIYIGKLKDIRTATLLQMVVNRNIQLIKGERKYYSKSYNWYIHVVNYDACSYYEKKLLAILNNGIDARSGIDIAIQKHTATRQLLSCGKELDRFCVDSAIKDGLLEQDARRKKSETKNATASILKRVFLIYLAMYIFVQLIIMFEGFFANSTIYLLKSLTITRASSGVYLSNGKIIEGLWFAVILICILIIATGIIVKISKKNNQTFKYITHEGIAASRYLDGLKLYISMAEKDRLKFLQSVEGADTTPEGIVKLYEKLLPYAALFGLEDSWMYELSRYCEINHIQISAVDYSDLHLGDGGFSRAIHTASTYAVSSTKFSYSSSSYGSSSSSGGGGGSSSGGGGGGFSGGGGGGGGGHGR